MKTLMKMVLGASCAGLRLLLAQLVLGAGSVFASIPTPEVKFTFDTPTDNCWPENEGKSGQYVSFMGSYSSKGANQGATYVESMLGKGVHSYSPWCIVERDYRRDPYTVEFCFKATTAANNILLCLGNLNSGRDAIMVTTESAHSIKLVRVRNREVKEEVSIPVTGKMSDYHICFLCFEVASGRAELTAYVDDVEHPVTIKYDEEDLPVDLPLQILGGYNKQNEMADYPHGCGVVDVDSYVVTQPNTENVIDDLRIWLDDLRESEIKEFMKENLLEKPRPEVPYLEWKDGQLSSAMLPSNSYKRVTVFTETLSDGWYVVDDEIAINHTLTVDGHAKLILCDGASLTVNGEKNHAGIEVASKDNALSIYGQANGTGRLTANGATDGAGIGGGPGGSCGRVTINGGTVMATGGDYGAGIGGGGKYFSAVGGGGTVMINGGTVTATGGYNGAGIGGGNGGGGGTVTINGGRLKVVAGSGASQIGEGSGGTWQGTVEISGGLFAWEPERWSLNNASQVFVNHDPSTCADYPWTVFSAACVTFERVLAHTTAVWTSGDGSVKTPISGKSFFVPKGTTGVKVIFASESPYAYVIDKTEYAFSGAVNADCVIPAKDLPTAQAPACPDGYVRLDYIESTTGGGQYIDTGIKSSPTLAATMDYMAFEHTGHVNLGTVNSGDANWRYFDYEGGPLFDCVGARAGDMYGNPLALNTRYVANVGSQGDHIYLTVTDAGTREEIKSFTSAYNGTLNPANVFVFGGWSSGSIVCTPMRLYSLTLRDFKNAGDAERTILAEFVPCVRLSDGAIGLYDLVGERFVENAGTSKFVPSKDIPGVSYLEWKDGKLVPAELPLGSYEKVTSETRTLSDGWYVVKDEIVIEADGQGDNLTVSGHAKLILCDGASLTVTGYYEHPGIEVLPDNELSIYGQSNGTGRLTANGRLYGAGIGGGRSGSACGTVTINGGTVTATGGQYGAGIGGGGGLNGTGGTVTINGGTVTATGNDGGAGIGGGRNGSGGAVAINGGRLKVIAGDEASVIGAGRNGEFPGTVEISSGLFAWKPNEDRFVGLGERLFSNTDASTCADYPWVVTTGACVAFGRSLEHATVAWTSGDGTVTNAINGNFFIVPKGTSGVKVIFTPEDRYALDKTEYVFAGAINGDCEIPAADLPTATYLYVEVAFGRDLANLIAVWTSGDGSKTNAISGMRFEVLKGVPFKVLFAPESSVFELVGPSVYESEGIWESMRIPEELIPVAKGMTFEYVDADGSVKLCNNHNALTDATPELKSGWYVVVGKMSRGSITVNGDVHLILTDDCELTATGGGNLAGVAVEPGNSLVIYGQRNGTGKLTATGGWNAAGIGGQNPNYLSEHGNYGTITINGGTVTAMGGENGAGIGGGYKGENGAVAINGGRLKVVAGNGASVIGAGEDGISQGTVAISGGIFTWKPNEEWLVDQSLKFFDNPDASTCADYPWAVVPAVCVTFGREIEHMTAVWTSGDGSETNAIDGTVFRVPKGVSDVKVIFTPEDGYMLDKTEYVFANAINADFEIPAANLPTAIHLDVEVTFGRALDHITAVWTSSDGTLKAPISGLSFLVPKGMPFKVLFAAESSLFELVGPSVYESEGIWESMRIPEGLIPVAKGMPFEYVDADGSVKSCANYDIVTNATSELTNGWHVVVGKVSCRSIVVKGEVHLILTDDCELTATCEERLAGVAVESGNSLVIYGQKKGTGKLTATCNDGGDGSDGCAGIGGGYQKSGGSVTINGGTVIATGGGYGAGIGGGDQGSGGTITINGGTVTAIGDDWYGAGIGSGRGGAGGTVMINGGTVTAQGGRQAAGIGGGGWGAGGTVTINGGRLKVVAGNKASVIGAGYAGGSQGTVAISGGIFAWQPNDEWLANREVMSFVDNPDVTTAGDYPWAVYLSAVWVSFGRVLEHATAAWTSGDGAVTNAIEGTAFCVPKGESDVKVIFTPEDRYTLDKTEYVFAEAIDADFVIPDTALPMATYRYAAVAFERAPYHATAVWTSGDGTVTNAIEGMSFEVLKGTMGCKVIFTPEHNYRFVGVGESGVRVLASPLTADCLVSPPKVELIPGTVVNPWNVGEAVTAYVSDEGALVIKGTGEMDDFVSAADVPWAEAADKVTAVTVSEGVILGKNALAGFADTMTVNGLSISFQKMVAASTDSAGPSGAISGAEFDQVEIVGGKAYLDVCVYTSDAITNQNWSVATNGVIEVPAPGKQGFFYLISKPAVPSNKPFVPPPLPIEQ